MIDVKASGGLEALTQHVLNRAKEAASAIIEHAHVRADEILKQADETSRKREQELVRVGMVGVEQERRQIISQARLRLKEGLLETKARIRDQVMSQVRESLEKIQSEGSVAYLDLLVKLCREALSEQESNTVVIYLSERDAKRYEKEFPAALASKLNMNKVEIRTSTIGGGVIVEYPEEHLQIDASFDELLREALPAIDRLVEKEVFLSKNVDEESKDDK
jgi:vacuolar-type H+-ATPase subunit E/Vma4